MSFAAGGGLWKPVSHAPDAHPLLNRKRTPFNLTSMTASGRVLTDTLAYGGARHGERRGQRFGTRCSAFTGKLVTDFQRTQLRKS